MKLEKETRLKLAIGLSSTFCVVEVVGGYIANSIAIYSDAAHLLTDIAGFAIALLAVVASKAPGTKHLTYGFARAEVFGALGSILSLWVITAFLLYAAYIRALKWFEGHAETVDGFFMFLVACFGVCVNICLGLVFQSEHGGAMHPSHSHCNHDHSHDGHSHGHDHGSSCDHGGSKKVKSATYHILALNDIESGRSDDHDHAHASHDDHSSCSGHGHDHGHDSHSSHGASDTTKLLSGSEKKSYNSYDDHGHDHGHDAEHDHSTCSGHGHSEHDHDHSGHDHDHDHSSGGCSGHGHDGHEHAHGHTDSASDLQKTFEPSDVNIEAAYLHVLTDLIQSIGVALAGLIIWFKPHWQIIDPLCTFIFSFIALKTTIPLLIRVFGILFEGTPSHVISYFVLIALVS